mgnify:CR=1 FL=1
MSSIVKTLAGSTGKRARSKAANRRAILQAGRRVFARIGFEATTVRDIIRETELAAGTFYNYFKSKEEVFEAIAEDSTHRFRSRLQDVRAYATDFETYVHDAYRAYFGFIATENEEPIRNGAPLRMRIERQLGYKHAKYLTAIEAVASLDDIGKGQGGYWEDRAGYQWYAGI